MTGRPKGSKNKRDTSDDHGMPDSGKPAIVDIATAFEIWAGYGDDQRSLSRLLIDMGELGSSYTIQQLSDLHDAEAWPKRLAKRRALIEAMKSAPRVTFDEAVAGRSSLLQAAEELGTAMNMMAARMTEAAQSVPVATMDDLERMAGVVERTAKAATGTLLAFKQIVAAASADVLNADPRLIDGEVLDMSDITSDLGDIIRKRIGGPNR